IENLNKETLKSEEISQLVQQYKEIKDELREPCYITYHENNVIQFTYHNQKGADLEQENYEAFVDKIYLYYANYLKSPGTIKLNRAPLFLESKENPLSESNKLHYSFCNDKGNLVIEEVNNPDIQPRLKTVVLDAKTDISSQHLTSFKAGPNK
ncbi:8547_t:CDS:2, partial [Racocetra persica]